MVHEDICATGECKTGIKRWGYRTRQPYRDFKVVIEDNVEGFDDVCEEDVAKKEQVRSAVGEVSDLINEGKEKQEEESGFWKFW